LKLKLHTHNTNLYIYIPGNKSAFLVTRKAAQYFFGNMSLSLYQSSFSLDILYERKTYKFVILKSICTW